MEKQKSHKQILIIAGPTGSGESTITNEIISRYPDKIVRLVTATTRPPRKDEKHAHDYYFLTKDDFLQKQKSGEMLEVTYVPNRDTYYGSYEPDLRKKLESGYIVIVNPDIVGAKFYKQNYNATTIFITPKNKEELAGRLRHRNPEMSDEELNKRLQNAEDEIKNDMEFYDYTVENANGGLERSVSEVLSIMKKEGYSL